MKKLIKNIISAFYFIKIVASEKKYKNIKQLIKKNIKYKCEKIKNLKNKNLFF